jgi:hypothetical protein
MLCRAEDSGRAGMLESGSVPHLSSVADAAQTVEKYQIPERMLAIATSTPSYGFKGALIAVFSLFAQMRPFSFFLQKHHWEFFRFDRISPSFRQTRSLSCSRSTHSRSWSDSSSSPSP